jgi:hypothetical protein
MNIPEQSSIRSSQKQKGTNVLGASLLDSKTLSVKKTDEQETLETFAKEQSLVQENPLRLVMGEYFSIKTKDGRLIKLKLNSTQRKLFTKIAQLRAQHKPIRAWLLKYRQGGISTEVEAIIYALTSQQPSRNSLIMADEEDKSDYLFQMSKLYQEQLDITHHHLAPALKKSNSKSLEFSQFHSQIIIETGRNIQAARAFTYQYVHLSEVAFFPDLKGVLDALNQSVPDHWDTLILGETTANGMNEFYKEWMRAIEGKTDWLPIFFPWFMMEEYRLPLQDGKLYPIDGINFAADSSALKFETEEHDLTATHELDPEQVNWRRWAIVNKCQGNILTFKQEYPSTWEEAFSTSGDMYFDLQALARQMPKKPISIGELFKEQLKWIWRDLPHGRIHIYEKPVPGEQYDITGDASEALGQDEASALVQNKRLNHTVAIVAGQYPPEELAAMLVALGNYYNMGMIAQENKGYGYQVNQLVFANYGNVYRKIIDKNGVKVESEELGFNTNSVTRPQMLSMLAEEILHNSTTLNAKELISQCRTFVIKRDKDGKMTKIEAQTGYQDGLVICRAIASYIRSVYPYKPVATSESHVKQARAAQEANRSFGGINGYRK